jgi:hypothetical protein
MKSEVLETEAMNCSEWSKVHVMNTGFYDSEKGPSRTSLCKASALATRAHDSGIVLHVDEAGNQMVGGSKNI